MNKKDLIETFGRMVKEAEAQTTEQTAAPAETDERMEILAKYASWADEQLRGHYGEGQYSAEDVQELAEAKLEEDADEQESREKVAEYYQAGQIMYAGFKAAAESDSNE